MDIGTIIEIGEREVPAYRPGPTMVPVTPSREDQPQAEPVKERETVEVER